MTIYSLDILLFLFGKLLPEPAYRFLKRQGQVVWYSHLLKSFPQFIVIHTVKGFGIVNKVEIDVFLGLSCFFSDQQMLAI